MNKIKKFLNRLDQDRKVKVLEVVDKIIAGDLQKLDVKKLKGDGGIYRIRLGRVRILFIRVVHGYEIMDITNRDDNTYNLN